MRCSALLLALASLLLLSSCRSSNTTPAGPETAQVRAALEARLAKKKLSYRWVVCIHTKQSFAGSVIFRCNVNFGEPHIVRYCAMVAQGRLVTNREQRGIRCGRDAG